MSAILFAAALAAGAPPAVAAPDTLNCRAERPITAQSLDRPGARRLAELPPGSLYRTVLRRVGDCDIVEVNVRGAWTLEPSGRAPRPTPARR
ncbi:hypothetical protein [Phenylobacterium sp.]|jgi:hypothetical protein|uniref:hypothetical protein n=1 Tax=Phenylobacterium sp. TaxID=1871053 RepID=UPI002E302D8A|nr:hypothetical protein [Phenylobacterium sp.]HEX2560378.1 hypothetical protein [Phenylobacterium sp.]